MKALTNKIQTIINQAGGTWGISLLDLDSNEKWELNANRIFYSASIIKVPIMIAAFAASHRNELELSETITLKREQQVGGSGVLQHMTPGTKLTIYDLITLMIIQSDNTATNMLIERIGKEKIQQTMKAIGLEKSNFYNKLMIVPVDREGSNEITAHEMTMMLEKMAKGKIISLYACEQMIDILKKQQVTETLPSKIPDEEEEIIGTPNGFALAHKTGNVSGIRHDIGIFYVGERKMVASILSENVDDIDSLEYFGQIGLEIYHWLQDANEKE